MPKPILFILFLLTILYSQEIKRILQEYILKFKKTEKEKKGSRHELHGNPENPED